MWDAQDARRARQLVALSLMLGPTHLLAAALSTLLRGPNLLAAILLGGAVGVSLTPGLLRALGRPTPAAAWFLTANLSVVSMVAWLGYGPLSPAAHTFVLFPVIGLVLGGARLGVPFAAIAISQIVALVVAERSGVTFPLEASGPAFVTTHALVMSGVLIMVIGFLGAYDAAWRSASAQVEEANRAKSTFLAHMSHELRTPLNAVIGYTELLLEDASPQQRGDLARVEGAGRHLLELVDQLLDLARIEAGRLELSHEVVDLDALTADVLDEVRPLADRQRARLVREVAGPLSAHTDRLRVRQVLLNLLSNACKFTEDGTVTVRAARAGGRIHIEVQDDGVGMDAAELVRVFEPFEQGHAGVHRGTGLGLAISRRLCEALGGTLTAESAVGVGTCFRIDLPAGTG